MVILPFIRARLPETRGRANNARQHLTANATKAFIKDRAFWVVLLATLAQGLAYFIPILWLPSASEYLFHSSTFSH